MRPDELQHLLDQSPVHRALRLHAEPATAGEVRLCCRPGPQHAGTDGGAFLHGGVIATLLDTAATFALIQASGNDWATVDLRVDYLRPAPIAALVVTGTAAHVGSHLGRATAVLSETGTGVLATAAGTFTRLRQPLPERS